MNQLIQIHPDVKKALEQKMPIVALESTIISHGMPYPDNVKMALEVERIIREEGAIPATIAILNGIVKVGLTTEEVEFLAKAKDVYKVGKRDFGFVVSQKKTGATTVSGTSLVANLAGIHVFATGGIGGVHRGAQESFDISRDLEELASLPIAVVCAGAKSILDLGLTLEYLETKGVEVIGYQTDLLPAFYSRTSNFKVNYRLDSAKDIAKLLKAKWALGLSGGAVIANPIPESHSMDFSVIDAAIQRALKEAEEKGIKGQDVTPFLLAKIKEITGGDSLVSNIELVYNNARLAAQIAKHML
ncbi:MAG TPA: pseudouridine-5'-phosphate glycosidase [Bacilli bacterium]|nr:pseudouridine-5'-phosphate glycosidase [Bacilli bacterium]